MTNTNMNSNWQVPATILTSFKKTYEYLSTNDIAWEYEGKEYFRDWYLFNTFKIRRKASWRYDIEIWIPEVISKYIEQNWTLIKSLGVSKEILENWVIAKINVAKEESANKSIFLLSWLNAWEWNVVYASLNAQLLKLDKEWKLAQLGFVKNPNVDLSKLWEDYDDMFDASELEALEGAIKTDWISTGSILDESVWDDEIEDIEALLNYAKWISKEAEKEQEKSNITDKKLREKDKQLKWQFVFWNVVNLKDQKKFADVYIPYNKFTPAEEALANFIPPIDEFELWTLDETTKDLMISIWESIEYGDSLLLEGPTAASKTSAIRFMGYLTNTPVVRIPFTSGTSSDEIVWKFIPFDLSVFKVDKFSAINGYFNILKKIHMYEVEKKGILEMTDFVEKLKKYRDWYDLAKTTKSFISKEFDSNPKVDYDKIKEKALDLEMENQGFSKTGPFPKFLFKEGPLTKWVKLGAFIIFDELNLAPADQIERLNEIFENSKELNLVEYDSRKIKFHPETRLFATMNPATYAWRKPLSPAFKNRFVVKQVWTPSEASYKMMIDEMIYYRNMWKTLKDTNYKVLGANGQSELNLITSQIAKFHKELEEMLDPNAPKICIGERELPVITRRDLIYLIKLIDYKFPLVNKKEDFTNLVKMAFEKYYVSKFAKEKDKESLRANLTKFFWK